LPARSSRRVSDSWAATARGGVEMRQRDHICSSGHGEGVPGRDRVQVADAEPALLWSRGVKNFRNF
jgi:hypothetical protein